MEVYLDIENFSSAVSKKPLVTLGTFDGVHLGHQVIIKRLVKKARESGRKSLLVTYEPHPQSVVAPESAPKILTTLEEKLYFLRKLNVDQVVVIHFKKNLAQYQARQFVEEILVGKLNVDDLIIGYDHAFGKNREGRVKFLNEAKKDYGFGLEIISPVKNTDLPIKSSRIREELRSGEFSKVIKMLGHSYPIWGTKIPGQGRGGALGYPTINLKVGERKLLPPDGVYAASARIGDKTWTGMMYKGKKPTFEGKSLSLEIHLFDFDQSQKTEKICLFVEEWIRKDMKFESNEDLKNQLKEDEKTAKNYFFKKGG
ncbi:MAG: bifunctional riboflavin kinase/FAD synthetase [Candidatus Zixiibacteriota bacterium]